MKLVSWNVNGMKSVLSKNFMQVFKNMNADIFCIQETKTQEGQVELELENYHQYWNYSDKKGYSGTAIFSKEEPINVFMGINDEELDKEGRVITLEFENYFIVNTYTPCYQKNIERQNFRMEWDEKFLEYIEELEYKKDVIICGDFNVAYEEIDLGNINKEILGFSDEERQQFNNLLNIGFIDSFRYKNQNYKKFTWWKNNKRDIKDNGCRLDYILVPEEMKYKIVATQIRNDIGGSDHCPIVVKMKI